MPSAAEIVVRLAEEKRLLAPAAAAAVRDRIAVPGGSRTPLVELLAGSGGLDEPTALGLLGEALAMPVCGAADLIPTQAALAALPRAAALRAGAFPLERRGSVLRVAVADPFLPALESLGLDAQLVLEPVLAAPSAIRTALARAYGPVDAPPAAGDDLPAPAAAPTEDAPMARLVGHLVAEALRRRASDIHVEPLARRLRVRLRIDGVLQEIDAPPARVGVALVSRLKLMARMSLDEKRVPQDGRIRISLDGREIDLRASCLPTIHGESMVLRVLEAERLALDWESLGLWPGEEGMLDRAVSSADGLVLVTGPTGSGKTTTLYTCLHRLNHPDRKIVTVEDPVEYQLPGINQVPVRPEAGMTFSVALRAMLRQAPNVIMVGEIRDRETAEIALNAAQTGHLVFSTLHTNDAPGAVARLIDLGVKPYLLAATLRAVVAQRLVRRVCPHCARPHEPSATELRGLGLPESALAVANWRLGDGCPSCLGTGHRGRVGLYELLMVGETLRRTIYDNVTAGQLRTEARRLGMRTLREDGLRKTLAGWTTIDEILAHTVGDAG